MLEALIKDKIKKLGKKIEVKSCGLDVVEGSKVEPNARKAMKNYGLVVRHTPTQITEKALERADTVITVTDSHKRALFGNKCYYKIFSLREAAGSNVPDPYGGDYETYVECAKVLNAMAEIIVENLQKAGKL